MSGIAEVVRLTGFSDEIRKSLTHYYAGLPVAGRIEAHRLQTSLARRHSGKKALGKEPEFFHAMLLLALHQMSSAESAKPLHRKGGRVKDEARNIRKIRISGEHRGKPAVVKRQIQENLDLIIKLRDRAVSWREISKFLWEQHRFKISPGYLCKIYIQIAANPKSEGGYR